MNKRLSRMIGLALAAALCSAVGVAAGEKRSYQKGKLLQMESAACGVHEKSGKGFAGAVLGTDSQDKKTREMLCQEYVLEADRIIYRIRPKEEKHPVLLPVGDVVQFRIQKDMLRVRIPEGTDGEGKEREYFVVSMTPRADAKESSGEARAKN